MLIVPDIQDVYTPLQSDVVVQLSEVSSKMNCCFNVLKHLNLYFNHDNAITEFVWGTVS